MYWTWYNISRDYIKDFWYNNSRCNICNIIKTFDIILKTFDMDTITLSSVVLARRHSQRTKCVKSFKI
jgi:hypothetical protein